MEFLELVMEGLLGEARGYRLPDRHPKNGMVEPTLRVAGGERVAIGDDIELRDPDGTPLADLEVCAVRDDGNAGTWVEGAVRRLRGAEHGPARASRFTIADDLTGCAFAVFSPASRPVDILRVLARDHGRRLVLVASASNGESGADVLVATLRELAAEVGADVRFVPSLGTPDGTDVVSEVLRRRGAVDPIDLRRPSAARATGAVVLLTGLSGAGKSTVARALVERLRGAIGAHAILLDGDDVRRELAGELTFSAEDRDRNVQRIAWVAARLAEVGAIAVCAPIAPFEESRQRMRQKVEPQSPFIVVHVATPLAVAEQRDRKGLYRLARAGKIADFTGIDSPYEEPTDADVVIDTSDLSVDQCVDRIAMHLVDRELCRSSGD